MTLENYQQPRRVVRWLMWGGILFLLYQMFLPGRLIGLQYPLGATIQPDTNQDVFFCHRLVNGWQFQLLLPGVEHYSIWLPKKKLHRGVLPDGLGSPLPWVDNELYLLDGPESQQEMLNAGLSCKAIPNVNSNCVEREIMRPQAEGRYGSTNHCQHVVVNILKQCGEAIRKF